MPKRADSTIERPSAPETDADSEALAHLSSTFKGFSPLEPKRYDDSMPLVEAKVVYTGSNPKRSVSLAGQLMREEIAGQVIETPVDTGNQCYDFARLDAVGKPITERLVTLEEGGPEYVGRPWCIVRHPLHLVEFFKFKDRGGQREFVVMVQDSYRAAFETFLIRHQNRTRTAEQELEENVKNA